MRALLTSLAIALAASSSATAQWSVVLQGGVHEDRLERPERTLTNGANAKLFSSPGEAPVIGLRGSFWARPHFGFDFGIAASQNRSWSGIGPVDSKLIKRPVFVSAAGLWRPCCQYCESRPEVSALCRPKQS
jgi:opacity protein-like surface antigen